ncbi:MAG: c-type cytochrome [Vicinamibacteria bacterium]
MRIRFMAVMAVLVGLATLALAAQEAEEGAATAWEVPAEAKAVPNPVENTPEAVGAGAELFKKHCLMCHGEAGKGDGPATKFMKPAPPDMTVAGTKDRMTDGEMFYKITTGKRPMPPMNRKLSETERWQVVHYVRTLQN